MKKGFTMVELIAIIILLAVISLVSFPIMNNLIKDTQINNEKDLVRTIIDEAKMLYNDYVFQDRQNELVNVDIYKSLTTKDKPSLGSLFINDYGNVYIIVEIEDRCYMKNYDQTMINLVDNSECDNIDNFKPIYTDAVLNGADPELDEGMIPVIISSNGSLKKANLKEEWYNYTDKEWANVVLVNETSRTKYMEAAPGTTISTLDVLAYFVWVPRYKYQIFNDVDNILVNQDYNTNTVELINIVFQDKYATKANGSKENEWLTHPAFTFGEKELNGIWVGKFETTGTGEIPTILPNKKSLRSQNVSAQFKTSLKFANNTLNNDGSITHSNNATYGINNTDSHLIKNSEWGAVAYLTTSRYGQGLTEVRINNSKTYITGCAATTAAITLGYHEYLEQTNGSEGYYVGCENKYNTEIGVLASTTGNITGIYDMNGGAWEAVMGVVESYQGSEIPSSGRNDLYNSGFTGSLNCPTCDTDKGNDSSITSIVGTPFPNSKYYDLYKYGATTANANAYKRGHLGDATKELASFSSSVDGRDNTQYHSTWNKDYARIPNSANPWFNRSGHWARGSSSGMFTFEIAYGNAITSVSFRTVLAK